MKSRNIPVIAIAALLAVLGGMALAAGQVRYASAEWARAL
jgi:hypothetical protein